MFVKLLTEHHLEFLSLKEGCRGSSKFTHVKMPHCWKSHALAHIMMAYSEPCDRFFYPTLTLMIDSFTLIFQLCRPFRRNYKADKMSLG